MNKFTKFDTLIEKYSAFLFDCDGVLWRGGNAIPHSYELLKHLVSLGKQVFFVTNNSMYTRQQLVDKMKKHSGFEFKDLTQVYTASYVAAMYAKSKHPDSKKVYALGAPVLAQEFKDIGFNVLSSQEHNDKYGLDYHKAGDVPFDKDVDMVVIGYDDKFNLYKLAYASYAVQNNVIFQS